MSDRIFVIDTSLFVNPYARKPFGKTPTLAVKGFMKKVKTQNLKVFMPPSIFNELKNFVEAKTMDDFEVFVRLRTPSIYDINLPAAVFYDFITDVRERINKGLRLAEEFAKNNHPDNDTKLGKLRDKYRDAMRSGIIDSKEDLELVLLAKEMEATLVTSDEGAIFFAKQLGCSLLPADKFFALIKTLKPSKGYRGNCD